MKRRRRDGTRDPQYAAIRAGLHRDPCPRGGNEFVHLSAWSFTGRRDPLSERVLGVFQSLDREERREIVRRRREARP